MPEPKALAGWDLAAVGEPTDLRAPLVPSERLLFAASPSTATGTYAQTIDIVGLDPRVDMAVTIKRRWNGGAEPASNITATITAQVLDSGIAGLQPVCSVDPADLFRNGGALDAAGDDVCLISGEAHYGLRLTVTYTRSGATSHDVVLTCLCRPRDSFGCADLYRLVQSMQSITAVTIRP